MSIFLKAMLQEMDKIKKQGDGTLVQLTEEQLYFAPDSESNSIAVLVQHIVGNMRSRSTDFLTTDGEKASRKRDAEFTPHTLSKEELMQEWEDAWAIFYETVHALSQEDLLQMVSVKGKETPAMAALMTQLVHYAGHIAQMMYIAKMQLQEDWQTQSIPKKK
ncbi:DUF1572 family protein [Kurthia sp. FSL E2-0154]|uniref:DUF1572 family protein n=1 Tax=Kurthia sp. FSL E2-0154 TaxID=2921358 RepID=UPI0030F5E64B